MGARSAATWEDIVSTSARRSLPPVVVLWTFVAIVAPPAVAQDPPATTPSFQAFSKFDFVPGEKVVAFEDFTQDAIGDFPAKWNTNGSAEIVTLAGKPGRWLKITKAG